MNQYKRKKHLFKLVIITCIALLTLGSAHAAVIIPKTPQPSASVTPTAAEVTISNKKWGIAANDRTSARKNVDAINKALAWASENQIKQVAFEKGTYYVDGQHTRVVFVSDRSIQVPSNLSINLNGSTLIQIPNNKEGYAIFTVVGSSNVQLFNGTLIGDRPNHDYSLLSTHEFGFGIDVRGGQNIRLNNLEIYDMTGDSILIGGKDAALSQGGTLSENIQIKDCKLHDNRRQGISVIGARNVSIANCEIYRIGMENGTNPSCGIDLENELDWPIEQVTITNNKFYKNKKSAVLVHRGSKDTVITQNTIDGYISLVSGDQTSIEKNTISNGGIYSVDTTEPINTFIESNVLTNANIEVAKNFATVISSNTLTNGVVKFNYASGAIYKNSISNAAKRDFAIQVFADKQAGSVRFKVYISDNKIIGTYRSSLAIAKYNNLTVITTSKDTQKYVNQFADEAVAAVKYDPELQKVDKAERMYKIMIAAGGLLFISAACVVILLIRKKRLKNKNA